MSTSPKDGVQIVRRLCEQAFQLWASATPRGRECFVRSASAAWERETDFDRARLAHHAYEQALVRRFIANPPKRDEPGPPGWAWRWEYDRSALLDENTKGSFGWYPLGPPDGASWDRPAINEHQSQNTEFLLAAMMIEAAGQVGPLREIVPEATLALPPDHRIGGSLAKWGLVIQIDFVRDGGVAPERLERAVTVVRTTLGRVAPDALGSPPTSLLHALSSVGVTLANAPALRDVADRRVRARDMGLRLDCQSLALADAGADDAALPPMVFTEPIEYISAITESVRAGQSACGRARALVRAGGAKPLDDATAPGTHARSVEIATLLSRTETALDSALVALPSPMGDLGAVADSFEALGAKVAGAVRELIAAIELTPPLGSGENRTGTVSRVTVDMDALIVQIDTKRIMVSTKRQAEIVRDIVKSNGSWKTGRELATTKGERIDRFVKDFPKAVFAIIEAKPGAGYRLRPKWVT